MTYRNLYNEENICFSTILIEVII